MKENRNFVPGCRNALLLHKLVTKKPSPSHKFFFLGLGKLDGFSCSSIAQVTFFGSCHLVVFGFLFSLEPLASNFLLTHLKKLDFISLTFVVLHISKSGKALHFKKSQGKMSNA